MEVNRYCCRNFSVDDVANINAPSTDGPPNSNSMTVKTGLEISVSRPLNQEESHININVKLKTEFTLVKYNENQERLFECSITKKCNLKTFKIELNSNSSPEKIFLVDSAKKTSSTFLESQIDPYTKESFKELIQKNIESKLPYYIATCTDPLNEKIDIYDGGHFLKNYSKLENSEDLLVRFYLNSFKMYKSTKVKNVFRLFCDSKNLNINGSKKAKFILASDTSAEISSQGQTALFVTDYYEKKFKNSVQDEKKYTNYLNKATFWLERALKLKNPNAYWKLGFWFLTDILKTEHNSAIMALPCFKLAIDYSGATHENLERMKATYNKLLATFQKANSNNG